MTNEKSDYEDFDRLKVGLKIRHGMTKRKQWIGLPQTVIIPFALLCVVVAIKFQITAVLLFIFGYRFLKSVYKSDPEAFAMYRKSFGLPPRFLHGDVRKPFNRYIK